MNLFSAYTNSDQRSAISRILSAVRCPLSAQKKGFTIAELILVIAIIGILFSIAGNTYRNQRQRYEFNDSLQQVLSLINTARNYATTSRAAYYDQNNDGTKELAIPPEGYGVYIEKSATAGASKIILFANTTGNDKYDAGSDVIEETYIIPKATVFGDLLNGDEQTGTAVVSNQAVIIFRPPLAEVIITDNVAPTPAVLNELTLALYPAETPKIQQLDEEGEPVEVGGNPVMIPPPTAKRYITISKTAGFPELIIGK